MGAREDPRERFGARNQREARMTALGIVERLIDEYEVVPTGYSEGIPGVPDADVDRLRDALSLIAGRMATLRKGKRQ